MTSTVEYAQCYTGFCTLNGDNITASCGCLSLRPSAANEGKLDLGWGSAVLAASSKFRKVANLSLEGDDDAAITELEAAIADGSLWDEYDFDTTPSRVSLYSSDNPYFDQSVTHCSDVYAAQCMGAPCWDTPYDSIWNVTCICPYHHESYVGVTDMRDDMCEDAKEDTGCAAIGFGVGATTYSAKDLEEMVDAVVAVPAARHRRGAFGQGGYDEGGDLAGSRSMTRRGRIPESGACRSTPPSCRIALCRSASQGVRAPKRSTPPHTKVGSGVPSRQRGRVSGRFASGSTPARWGTARGVLALGAERERGRRFLPGLLVFLVDGEPARADVMSVSSSESCSGVAHGSNKHRRAMIAPSVRRARPPSRARRLDRART